MKDKEPPYYPELYINSELYPLLTKNHYNDKLNEIESVLTNSNEIGFNTTMEPEESYGIAGLFLENKFLDEFEDWKSERYADLKKFVLKSNCTGRKKPTKGPMEKPFLDYLKKENFEIYIDRCLIINNIEHYPDFILEYNGIFLIVEIDEAYIAKNGVPIHYYFRDDKGVLKFSDHERDKRLRNKGFEIVRFAEIQIANHPKECIRFIHYVFDSINSLVYPGRRKYPFPYLKLTEDEARFYAYNDGRLEHLPTPQKSYVTNAKKLNYDKKIKKYTQF